MGGRSIKEDREGRKDSKGREYKKKKTGWDNNNDILGKTVSLIKFPLSAVSLVSSPVIII